MRLRALRAMLDARHDFLADIAAFVEIDAGELVHVGLVREGVAIDEIHAAARHAERDAVRFVGLGLHQFGAEIGGGLRRQMRRQHHPHAERRQPRIGIAKPVFGIARLPVPHRHHAEHLGQVLRQHLGAQLVEIELVHQRRRERARAVEEEAAAVRRRRLGHDEIHDDLALRRQQRGKARLLRADLADIVGGEPVEEAPGVVAGDLHHAAVGKKRCLHRISMPSCR